MLNSILALIVDTVAGILGGAMLLRFWTQAIRVRAPNSLAHFIAKLTDWLVKPFRRIIPGVGGHDWASLAGASTVALLAVAIILAIAGALTLPNLLVLALVRLLNWALYGFMALIIISAVFSWVNPQAPLAPFIQTLTDPLMRPLRKVIPLIGSVDLSPLVALLLLQILLRIVDAIPLQLL
ncbi:MAG: YggT family protein [Pseudomonadota bacterium]